MFRFNSNFKFFIAVLICIQGLSLHKPARSDELGKGVIMADNKGCILYQQNGKRQLIPASILKILTSLAAMETLGEGYRFSTRYSFDAKSHDLYIKGFGDPLFISEVIEPFSCEIISRTGLKQIRNIIVDQTYFSQDIKIPGKSFTLNPYDASVGALCANFNTIFFKWDEEKKKFISAESQTPLLPVFLEDIRKTNLKNGRIVFYGEQARLYPGRLIKYFLEKNGIPVTGKITEGRMVSSSGNIHTFLSPFRLQEIVRELLKYSNNFIANQIVLTMGAEIIGPPASLNKGIKILNSYAKNEVEIDINLIEGSGLSRENRISPDQMLKVLMAFMPYHTLLNHEENDLFKTGTLEKVRTRAGYLIREDDRLYPYVIMTNGENKSYDAILKKLKSIIADGGNTVQR